MKRTVLIAVMVVALLSGLTAYAFAATTGKVNVTAAVPAVLSLTINGNDASTTAVTAAFGTLDPSGVNTASATVGVKSNSLWSLSYAATDFTDGTNTIPVSVMTWDDGAAGHSGTFGATGTVWASGTGPRGIKSYTHTYTIDMSNASTADTVLSQPSGNYASTITYTLTAP